MTILTWLSSPRTPAGCAWLTCGPTRLAASWRSFISVVIRTKANETTTHEVVGEVEGKTCLLVDDMVDTAGTMCQAALALKKAWRQAGLLPLPLTPILSDPAAERINNSPIEELIVTNTLKIRDDIDIPAMTLLSIAPLIAKAIQEVFEDGSVTSLFR